MSQNSNSSNHSSSNNNSSNSDDELFDETDEIMGQMLLQEMQNQQGEGSNHHTRRYMNRKRVEGHQQIYNDYFLDGETSYSQDKFRRRYRMGRPLFIRIMEAVSQYSQYFTQRCDATGKAGLSPLQKCTAAIRQLAYGGPADSYDEYIRIGETTSIQCLFKFCRAVIEIFSAEYLRRPNANDIERITQLHQQRHGFPGMLGSLDCMHWEWKNCPVAWKGQHTRGDIGCPTLMLEAVASQDLWIWHAFFGVAGSNNDINVLNQSPLFNDVLQGVAPPINFTINGTQYNMGYYLTDGIYPEWATFVKSYPYPADPKRKKFKQMQEAARKDVERAFGVLQSRWAIVRGPARFWYKENLRDIMYTCIILHNMIVEDEGDGVEDWEDDEGTEPVIPIHGSAAAFQQFLIRRASVRQREGHHQLRQDLVEHIWEIYGNNDDLN